LRYDENAGEFRLSPDAPMSQSVQSVVIVGGGTAGWLTAGIIAARQRARMQAGFSVTLVESPTIKIIGVGEGTWPTLRTSLEKMGVSETEFFRECDASFNQGASFASWTTGAPDD
jgi:tryptophan halogenase